MTVRSWSGHWKPAYVCILSFCTHYNESFNSLSCSNPAISWYKCFGDETSPFSSHDLESYVHTAKVSLDHLERHAMPREGAACGESHASYSLKSIPKNQSPFLWVNFLCNVMNNQTVKQILHWKQIRVLSKFNQCSETQQWHCLSGY